MKCKKMIAAVVAAVVAASCALGGCGGKNQQGGNDISAAESSQMVTSSSAGSEQSSSPEPSVKPESKTSQPVSNTQESSQIQQPDESSENEASTASGKITPKICEITDDEGHKLYTMGTIHIADESIMNMPAYFETAFAESDSLAVECNNTDTGFDLLSITKFMYTDGTKITDHVSAEDYQKVLDIVKDSPYYNEIYAYIKPMMWVSLGEITAGEKLGMDAKYGVDQMLINKAVKEGKDVIEVEGTKFQMDLITDMPENIQNFLFHSMAQTENYTDEMSEALRKTYENWKKGEEIADDDIGEEELTDEEKQLLAEYNRILLTDRNVGMADKAERYLASGDTVFMAVGSAHFYGEGGIYQLLEQRGYHIRQLTDEDAKPVEGSVMESTASTVSETDPGIPRAA